MSRVKTPEELYFLFFFPEIFSDFEQKKKSDFWPKIFKKFSKLPSKCPEEKFVAWNLFLKIWIVLDFLQKTLQWFSNIYLRVQNKNSGRNNFFILLFRIFVGIWAKKFSDFWPKSFKKFSKLPSTCPEEQFVAWIFFQNFWTNLDFLQKPLAWFSNICLRVQNKNSGRNNFFILLFRIFVGIWAKKFSDFWPKSFKKFSKLPSTCPEEQFVAWIFFFNFWIVLDFLQKPLACFSKFYLRVQSKNCGGNVFFLFFFSDFFSNFERKFSDFWPKSFKKFSKLPSTCPEEQFVAWIFFLIFESFWIFCRNLWHVSQNSIYVSRVKIAEEKFFMFFFSELFSEFEQKNFRTFGQKTSRSFQIYLLRVQRNSLWLEIFF